MSNWQEMLSPDIGMSEDYQYKTFKVSVNKLKNDMIITAYSGFNTKYHSMDEKVCEFIRHNFKSAKSIITRGEKKLSVRVNDIKAGDSLRKIYDFPPGLKKTDTGKR